MTKIQAWHFTGAALRDGRPIPADGEVLHHDGPLVMCASGLQWSRTPLAALGHAPGATLCRVEVWGDVVEDDDKGIAHNRVILWRMDATDLLREFGRRCALDVAHLWNAPEIVLDYLRTGDETKRRAAAYAAYAADAAYAAAYAAYAAAYAARAAHAARAAADAARAARAAQNARLTDMIDRARERVLSGERAPSASGSIAP
jgi:hypothetical protein